MLTLGRAAELGAPLVSVGGAGTFDGIFPSGIIAGLLAQADCRLGGRSSRALGPAAGGGIR